MHVRTKAEKLMPRGVASSFAASRKVSGIRRVTETWSPFTRKLLISVSSELLLISPLQPSARILHSLKLKEHIHRCRMSLKKCFKGRLVSTVQVIYNFRT